MMGMEVRERVLLCCIKNERESYIYRERVLRFFFSLLSLSLFLFSLPDDAELSLCVTQEHNTKERERERSEEEK